jgi:uncharacterized protein YjiS (DUF1127 family)
MTTITMPRAGGLSETGLSSMVAAASTAFAAIVRAFRIRRDRHLLQSMPDYLLRDIGIRRSEINAVTEFGRPRGPVC